MEDAREPDHNGSVDVLEISVGLGRELDHAPGVHLVDLGSPRIGLVRVQTKGNWGP